MAAAVIPQWIYDQWLHGRLNIFMRLYHYETQKQQNLHWQHQGYWPPKVCVLSADTCGRSTVFKTAHDGFARLTTQGRHEHFSLTKSAFEHLLVHGPRSTVHGSLK